jgi:hypothetical protein
MLKVNELRDPGSCLNRALPNERLFVLLARDASAPEAIRAWIAHRVRTGKNALHDHLIQEAVRCADAMDAEREAIRAQKDQGACVTGDRVGQLAHELADSTARSDIECNCALAEGPGLPAANEPGHYYDTASVEDEDRDFVATALEYLELRGVLERHPERAEFVRFTELATSKVGG